MPGRYSKYPWQQQLSYHWVYTPVLRNTRDQHWPCLPLRDQLARVKYLINNGQYPENHGYGGGKMSLFLEEIQRWQECNFVLTELPRFKGCSSGP